MRTITLEKFYELFEQVKDKFTWEVRSPAGKPGDIRGEIIYSTDHEVYNYACPVTAVVNTLYNCDYDPTEYPIANDLYLHLSIDLVEAVTDAADAENLNKSDVRDIRNKLLDILGLEEDLDEDNT